jgi:molybdopterin converting factor small subunit
MAIEVRIPTILRTYTGGEKAVAGQGGTLADVLVDLDSRHPGLRDRIVDDKGLRRFVNVYVNDEDVRFMGGLETAVKDGDTVTVLPAVAGGASAYVTVAGGASAYVTVAGGASAYVTVAGG